MADARSTSRPLIGRVTVVTGASRGAGRGIALELRAARETVKDDGGLDLLAIRRSSFPTRTSPTPSPGDWRRSKR